MPLLGLSSISYDMIVYLCTKVDDSNFSHTRDIIGAWKFTIGHVTLRPFKTDLSAICWDLVQPGPSYGEILGVPGLSYGVSGVILVMPSL